MWGFLKLTVLFLPPQTKVASLYNYLLLCVVLKCWFDSLFNVALRRGLKVRGARILPAIIRRKMWEGKRKEKRKRKERNFDKRKKYFQKLQCCKLWQLEADGFHRKWFLKWVRHRSKSCDSSRHFYSDKLHHKDKWKRRNYCSRAGHIAATRKCTSHRLLLYSCECFGGRVWCLLEIE